MTPRSLHGKYGSYGWVRDSLDARDHVGLLYVPQPTSLPAHFSLRDKMPGIYNQLQIGSCTANAIAGVMQYQEKQQGEVVSKHRPSRLFIYFNERKDQGSINFDSGASIRESVKAVATYGACIELEWPYVISKFKDEPPALAYEHATRHTALQYARVPQTVNAIKACVVAGHPVVFGFTVYSSFESAEVANTGIMPLPNIHSEQIQGGHAVVVVGYKMINGQLYFEVRNSWGSSWGDNGYFWMPASFLVDPTMASDLWDVTTVK